MGDRIKHNVKVLLFLISALPILISGCSFPKIIILKDPLTPEEHLNLGVAYERREFDQAIREYQAAAKNFPSLFSTSKRLFSKNDWDQAEIYFKKRLKKMPKMPQPIIIWHGFIIKEGRISSRQRPLLRRR
jgi:tetratricopeptide (TPR) repeat protein